MKLLNKKELKELKRISNSLKPEFNLGKFGLTDSFIKSIKDYLIANEIVKIKVVVAENKEELSKFADDLAEKTESKIIDKKGFTFTLYK